MITIKCATCGHDNLFDQPYAFHAGFSNEGFLYNDEGDLTLTWSSFDPAYEAIVGRHHPWALTPDQRASLEAALLPAPHGGRWRFSNPARCAACKGVISGSITETIYCLTYAGSVHTDQNPGEHRFKEVVSNLRLYCDFQTQTVDGWCYILRYQNRRLDEVAASLGLYDGMTVTLYENDDPGWEIEFDGTLSFRSASPALGSQWMALTQEGTFRRIATGTQ